MGFVAIALALSSSLVWGSADFGGGSLTRRLPTVAVTMLSQAAGFFVLAAAVLMRGDLGERTFLIGVAAGAGSGAGLAAFYEALAVGTMSVVSPIAACGAVVPFAVSVATGERPGWVAVCGAALAIGGAALASLEERRSDQDGHARAVVLAAAAAVLFGFFIYFLGLGSREGDVISTLFGARVGSLTLLAVLALVTRSTVIVPRRSLAAVALVGLADTGANALFALASGHGLLALVSVLGSLYPIVTVMLAHVLLGERLTRTQQTGVAVALAGVAAIAAS